jgi:pimeloyl-ACP methyl ester carboxylesterase
MYNGTIIANARVPADLNGSNFTYPYPISLYRFTSQFQYLEMAFMDVAPSYDTAPDSKTVVLLHGNYFCGATWNATIEKLVAVGYRVIAPDHIGYCKSTKPRGYQFSVEQLATNVNGLLGALGIQSAVVVGHSFGGTVATRYSLMFGCQVDRLVLVDPIGLEDYTAQGVPYLTIDANTAVSAASTFASVQAYENVTYYVGQWRPAYDVWVSMYNNVVHGSRARLFALNQAQIVDVVLTQPIACQFPNVSSRALMMVGDKDTTAIGKTWASPAVAARLGHFNVLGPLRCSEMPNCTLVQFSSLGHAPQISDPDAFHAELLAWLAE